MDKKTGHSLNLSPEDDATYRKAYLNLAMLRDTYVAQGNKVLSKKYRQRISRLYAEFSKCQLPDPDPDVPMSDADKLVIVTKALRAIVAYTDMDESFTPYGLAVDALAEIGDIG